MRSVVALVSRLLVAVVLFACRGEAPKTLHANGRVEGSVRIVGTALPAATRVVNTTDPEVCGSEHSLEDLVVSPENRGIRYAIVAVSGLLPETSPSYQPERLVLDNVDCRFSPHASVATAGSTVEAVNSDPVLHTTHLYGPADINISLAVRGARGTRRLDRPGLYVVKCDIHGWMQAFVRVDPHPYHAVSDESGRFRIDGVPVGSYTLEVWHEKLGSQEVDLRVEEGKTVSVLIEYPSPEY